MKDSKSLHIDGEENGLGHCFQPDSRDRYLNALEEDLYDLIIVGGGVFGAAAAREASLRGLSVALVEAEDFCSGVSADSFKIVHGGIRYLQHGDLVRMRASCRERSAFLRIAPHLVEPLPILIPTYGHGKAGKALLRAGVLAYDLFTLDRNRGIDDPDRRIGSGRALSRETVLRLYEDLPQKGLTGGVMFSDARFFNPPRLTLGLVKSAVAQGGVAVNYLRAKNFIVEGGRVTGITAEDRLSGRIMPVKGRLVLNTAGPWTGELLNEGLNGPAIETGTWSRDACFVIRRRLPQPITLAIQGQTQDPDALLSRPARHLFLSPWRDVTLVGVWHKVTVEHPSSVEVTPEEIDTFIAEVNEAYPALALSRKEVAMWNAGLVPFGENEEGAVNLSYGKRSSLIDHEKLSGVGGLVSLIGLRYTMARGEAEKALDLVQKKLGEKTSRPGSEHLPIVGGNFDRFSALVAEIKAVAPPVLDPEVMASIARNYGTEYRHLFRLMEQDPRLSETLGDTSTTRAEVIYAVEYEMAQSLADVVLRRTDLGTAGFPGEGALAECADLMGAACGWSQRRREMEVQRVRDHYPDWLRDHKQ